MEDTIAAIATAYGEGGIGIIRISGSDALPLLEEIFVPGEKAKEAPEGRESSRSTDASDRKLRYGHVVDPEEGKVIDECMAVAMKGPRTYTTEDMAEVYCHGSVVALKNTLALILKRGARLAEPGEFTKRAFLGGRIDLSQAEAVIDMVRARTDAGYELAMDQLEGALSRRVSEIRKSLLDLLVDMTVNIDYPDEDIEEITLEKVEKELSSIGDTIARLVENSGTGRMIREGIKVAIAGRPNVGKSSLMNSLLRENRVIVTDIPGTTRDTIEEGASIRGIPVVMTDTAGIHETSDRVERLGIERSRQAFAAADYMILVLDGSDEMKDEDIELLTQMGETSYLVVINKNDLKQRIDEDAILRYRPEAEVLHTSLVDDDSRDEAMNKIEDRIEALVYGGRLKQNDSLLVGNVRHIELLRQAAEDVEGGRKTAAEKGPLELIEVDARAAYDALGEIIGETVSDEVLDEVFSRFCLGK